MGLDNSTSRGKKTPVFIIMDGGAFLFEVQTTRRAGVWKFITGTAGVSPNAAFCNLAGSGLAKSSSRSDFADVFQLY
jgi:hypothetical protein